MELQGYGDSDQAANLNTRSSVTGYVIYLGENPIFQLSQKQNSVSWSSTETEYKTLAPPSADIAWLRLVLKDMHMCLPNPPVLNCENQFAIARGLNPVFHSRIKHVDWGWTRAKPSQAQIQRDRSDSFENGTRPNLTCLKRTHSSGSTNPFFYYFNFTTLGDIQPQQ